MRPRGIGGGYKLRKELTYRHMKELVQRQQAVINALCAKLDEGRRLVDEILQEQYAKTKVEKVPLILPVGPGRD